MEDYRASLSLFLISSDALDIYYILGIEKSKSYFFCSLWSPLDQAKQGNSALCSCHVAQVTLFNSKFLD
jgi:hypothetical protein